MKKILFSAIIIAITGFSVQAQTTIFSENFSSGIPNTWTLINGNGAVPNANVNFINKPWIWDPNYYLGIGNCAISTSWFTPAGTADMWLITPPIVIPAGSTNVALLWDASAVNSQYADGYEVRISSHAVDSISAFTVPLFSVTHENTYMTTHLRGLTAYAGDTIRLAWRNNSTDDVILAVTNISIQINVPNANYTLNTFDAYNYMQTGSPYQFVGTFTNNGFQVINNMTLNYSVNGGPAVKGDITGLNVPLTTQGNYTHPVSFTPTKDTVYHVTMWGSAVDSASVYSTDTLSRDIYSISNAVNKKVLLEEFTGAWCGYCPYGTVEIDTMDVHYPYVIPVAVHDSSNGPDNMVNDDGTAISSAYAMFDPTAMVDRVFYLDQTDVPLNYTSNTAWDFLWPTYTGLRVGMESPANVSLVNTTYDSTNRLITSTVRADFLANVAGDYRLNLYVVEDSLTGAGAGWDQHNYFSDSTQGGSADPQSPLHTLPDPITGWYHRHVLRKTGAGAYGLAGIIPHTVAPGSTYSHTFTYTLPANYNAKHITLVGIVQEYTTDPKYRYVLNAEDMKLIANPTAIAPVSNDKFENVTLYPNPTNNQLTVQFGMAENAAVTAYVTNIMGQRIAEVYNGELNTGVHTFTLNARNFAEGVYFVTLKTVNAQITQRFVVAK